MKSKSCCLLAVRGISPVQIYIKVNQRSHIASNKIIFFSWVNQELQLKLCACQSFSIRPKMFPQFGQQLNLKQEKVTRSFPAEDYGSHSVLELLRLAMLPPAEIGHTGYFPNTQQHFEICSMKTQAGPWWGQMPAGLQLKPPVLLFKDQRANESSPARPCSHQRSLWVQHTQQVKEFKAASSNVTSRKTKAGTREALFTKNVLRLLAVKTWWIQQATEPQNKELPNRFRFKCVHLQSGFRKSSDKDRPHPITE